ncbi:zinc finger MYND domain-containing protein [Microdochium nivale]|nr:zinc finger MYND domain-containing protein [Microdochium nivale]
MIPAIRIRVHEQDDFVLTRPPSEHPLDRLCLLCPKRGTETCKQCNQAAYCSAACQKKDWKTHKHVCKDFAGFTEALRPSKHHVRALVFPADSDTPHWAWVKTRHDAITADTLCEHIGEFHEPQDITVLNLHAELSSQGRGLTALCNHMQRNTNLSIIALGKPGQLHVWPGPVLIVGHLVKENEALDAASSTRPALLSDLNMRDYRNAIDGLLVDLSNPCVADPSRYHRPKLLAFIMTCVGERVILGTAISTKTMEKCIVPAQPSHGSAQWACALPFMLGLPWVCRVLSPDCFFAPEVVRDSFMDNPEAILLAARFVFRHEAGTELPCNNHDYGGSTGGGDHHHYHRDNLSVHCVLRPGTVLIMDMYGQPIHADHVRAVSAFLRNNQELVLHKRNRGKGSAHDSTDTLSAFDRAHFELFWTRLKARPWQDLEIARGAPGPYERSLETLKDDPINVDPRERAMLGRVVVWDEPVRVEDV